MQTSVFIEFARAVKSRAELVDFEKYCRSNTTTRKHFTHVEGRKLYFQYPNQKEALTFLREAEKMIEKNGMKTERVYDN